MDSPSPTIPYSLTRISADDPGLDALLLDLEVLSALLLGAPRRATERERAA